MEGRGEKGEKKRIRNAEGEEEGRGGEKRRDEGNGKEKL